jgi:hypothetical protein
MKPAPPKTLQSKPEASTSWADVARASADLPTEPQASEDSFPGGNDLQAGDIVQHEKFGRCTVHKIVGEFVHMAPENGRVVKLSQLVVSFTPDLIEDGRRVFSTSRRQ